MKPKNQELKSETMSLTNVYAPTFFRIDNKQDKEKFESLISSNAVSFVHDEIEGQLREFIKAKNAAIALSESDYQTLIKAQLADKTIEEYGVWVYYPWSKRLVHLLDKEEFIAVRTNRNQYKITIQEKDLLSQKKIGVIGLSVGQSVALTLAMERVAGHLVLADFDSLELSNLNRIRTGVHNLGVPKVVLAAREISEIDPFIKVTCFNEGVNEQNIDDFLISNGKLDLLIEECDGLDIKILARLKARTYGIPVIMDTSDRGMLDVERFDKESSRPILHGLVENIDLSGIKNLSDEEKVPIILQLLGLEEISIRGKVSMIEVKQSINSWPQLASSVTLGGALVTDVSRRILLDQFSDSGRFYVDLEKLISDKPKEQIENNIEALLSSPKPISLAEMESLAARYSIPNKPITIIDKQMVTNLVNAACLAPSTGNDQPWKWLYKEENGILFLFHDESRSYSFGDFHKIASHITFGAAFENLYNSAIANYELDAEYEFFPLEAEERLVAAISFKPLIKMDKNFFQEKKQLSLAIPHRHTNRNLSEKMPVSQNLLDELAQYSTSIEGAKLQWITEIEDLKKISKIIGACDRMRILNKNGHTDFVKREMRWTEEDAERTRDGISIQTLGLTVSQLSALKIIKNVAVIKEIKAINGGQAFAALAGRTIKSASAMCFISMPKYNLNNFFEGGRAMERFWLHATNLGLAVHPLISPLYLFPRILHADAEGITADDALELQELRQEFHSIFDSKDEFAEVFLAKISFAEEPELKSYRLPIKDVLFFNS